MSEFSELDGIASEIVSDGLSPSDTIASDNTDSSTKRNRRKPPKSKVAIDAETAEQISNAGSNPAYQEMGQIMAASFFSMHMILLGPDFKPEKEETEAMVSAWGNYFEAKQINQISPELMLGLVIVGYEGKRLSMPNTQNRLKGIWERWKARYYARFNRGNNYQRENDVSETTSGNSAQ